MQTTDNENFLELLEIYIDMVEKQDIAIYHMSNVIRRQQEELQHLRNALQAEALESVALSQDKREAEEALDEYEAEKRKYADSEGA